MKANSFHFIHNFSVNFKKNEKVYNSAGSEVLKALQESENDPADPGKDELFSHYYTLACMLQVLNGDGGIFNDKLVD